MESLAHSFSFQMEAYLAKERFHSFLKSEALKVAALMWLPTYWDLATLMAAKTTC